MSWPSMARAMLLESGDHSTRWICPAPGASCHSSTGIRPQAGLSWPACVQLPHVGKHAMQHHAVPCPSCSFTLQAVKPASAGILHAASGHGSGGRSWSSQLGIGKGAQEEAVLAAFHLAHDDRAVLCGCQHTSAASNSRHQDVLAVRSPGERDLQPAIPVIVSQNTPHVRSLAALMVTAVTWMRHTGSKPTPVNCSTVACVMRSSCQVPSSQKRSSPSRDTMASSLSSGLTALTIALLPGTYLHASAASAECKWL